MKKSLHTNEETRIIYAKDAAKVIGKTERSGQRLLDRIRKKLGKHKGAAIRLPEFCAFMGMLYEEVLWVLT
ncbi:hypothetical protein [uncultured Chitinophaga sp.]|uniref:hypothetical protein n=1 Tax=uncultured Chitinophaga sp. TaxID=339340 RepID=UPI0025D4CDEA|nr:hypothetical protein [uncultured Chitinophaga sp.]